MPLESSIRERLDYGKRAVMLLLQERVSVRSLDHEQRPFASNFVQRAQKFNLLFQSRADYRSVHTNDCVEISLPVCLQCLLDLRSVSLVETQDTALAQTFLSCE